MDVGNAVRTASYTMLTVIWNHSESVVVPLCVDVCPIICFRGVKSLETCYFLWEPGSEDMVEGRRREQPLCNWPESWCQGSAHVHLTQQEWGKSAGAEQWKCWTQIWVHSCHGPHCRPTGHCMGLREKYMLWWLSKVEIEREEIGRLIS